MHRFTMIASGYVFFIREDMILLSRRFHTGYKDGMYSVPAGHIEDNETLNDGTRREVLEEVGVPLSYDDITLVHVMHRKEIDIRMDFFFLVKHFGKEPMNMEPEKCDDLSWFPIDHLPSNTIPYIREAIRCYKKHILFSEFGWR